MVLYIGRIDARSHTLHRTMIRFLRCIIGNAPFVGRAGTLGCLRGIGPGNAVTREAFLYGRLALQLN